MEDIENLIPDEVKRAIREHGFHKLAAAHYGVDEINIKTAAEIIGNKLVQRLQERHTINTGLKALADLSE